MTSARRHAKQPARRFHIQHRVVLRCAVLGLIAAAFITPCVAREAAGPAACEQLPALEAWLDLHAARWQQALSSQPGYERPARVLVCRLEGRWPFADNHRDRVYVRRLQTTDDQITLAHEYLHLAFKNYPSGHDEHYVETTARRLIADFP
jgi:uncharacterized protein YfaQ (DUF2300 family)